MRTIKFSFRLAPLACLLTVASGQVCNAAKDRGKQQLLKILKEHHSYSDKQLKALEKIFDKSGFMTQGNKVSEHPISRQQCRKKIAKFKGYENKSYQNICKDKYMAPIYKAQGTKAKSKSADECIDQFEFPNVPCEFPLVWVRASEAEQICRAIGKRLCDAQEWEDACAGARQKDQYRFARKGESVGQSLKSQRRHINGKRKVSWAYGKGQNHSKCATNSRKSPGCDKALQSGRGVWEKCGSNTYPSGSFPECKSSLDVYDQHGNAAEHMNLPLSSKQMTKNGGTGHVEMKGSWFIFSKISAHKDDCHWRAPYWHGTTLMHPKSHRNYHLGFRCCKSL